MPRGTPHRLTLKEDAPTVLLQNMHHAGGQANSTGLVVRKVHLCVLEAETVTRYSVGKIEFIPRINSSNTNSHALPDVLRMIYWPFPLRLSSAMTMNKSQGQTLRKARLYLLTHCFSHGQLRVAKSHVKSTNALKMVVKWKGWEGVDVENVVQRELLL